jgi:uncharacterized protein (TIGR03435 family)
VVGLMNPLRGRAQAQAARGATFDAASVKVTGPEARPPWTITGGPGTTDPSMFRAAHVSMLYLLYTAFGVSTDQIAGPAWLRDVASWNHYAIDATIPAGATKDQFHQMLQNLLVQRFHLAFHHEARSFPGYELVVDKGGPKFSEVTPAPEDPEAPPDPRALMSAPKGADDFPDVPGSRQMSQNSRSSGQTRTKYQERTMAEFVSNLGFLIGSSQGKGVLDGFPQPRIIDKTGLTGKYTFILEYYNADMARVAALAAPGAGSDAGAASPPVASEAGGGPDIFTAVRKQLGLRLDKVAAVPVDVIVVDSVDKVPTAN